MGSEGSREGIKGILGDGGPGWGPRRCWEKGVKGRPGPEGVAHPPPPSHRISRQQALTHPTGPGSEAGNSHPA